MIKGLNHRGPHAKRNYWSVWATTGKAAQNQANNRSQRIKAQHQHFRPAYSLTSPRCCATSLHMCCLHFSRASGAAGVARPGLFARSTQRRDRSSGNDPPRSPDVYLGTSKQQMEDKEMFKAPLRARCASLTINSSAPHANWAFLPMALCASPDESEHSEIGGAHDGQHSTPADRRSRLTFCPLLQQSQQWPGLVVWLGTHQIRHANRRSTCTATGALGENDLFFRANGPRAPLARRFDHLIQFTVVRKALFASRLQHCWLGRTMYKRAI